MLNKLRGKEIGTGKAMRLVTAVLAVMFLVATCGGFAYPIQTDVTIADAGKAPVTIRTTDPSVGKILSKQGIVLNEGDELNYDLSDTVQNDAVIRIYRAVDVSLTYMGESKTIRTAKTNVRDALRELGILPDGDDNVLPGIDTPISAGMDIQVVTNDHHEITVQEELNYVTTERENADLPVGERRVVQAGKKGLAEHRYSIWCENGKEVYRELLQEERLSEPVEEIVEYGTKSLWRLGVIPASAPTNYSKVETFTATAYDASVEDNGIWAGQTSTGMPLTYGVVAVDPSVIPYGTKMFIASEDGQYVYGYAIAGDCGGAIKGKRVDLFFPSSTTCDNFGRRTVKIYFMNE